MLSGLILKKNITCSAKINLRKFFQINTIRKLPYNQVIFFLVFKWYIMLLETVIYLITHIYNKFAMEIVSLLLQKNEVLVSTDLKNELLLFNPLNSSAAVLNYTGKLIWDSASKGVTLESFINSFQIFFVTPEDSKQFIDFFDQMISTGLFKSMSSDEVKHHDAIIVFEEDYVFTTPTLELYSEEFLREYLNDESFATFHDDTFSDLGGK